MRKFKFLLLLMMFSTQASAQGHLCPKTYKYIDLGNTLAEVEQACGKPTSATTSREAKTVTEPTEQWVYHGNRDQEDHPAFDLSNFVAQPHDFDIYLPRMPKLYITFRQGRVSSVTLDSQEVGSTSLCGETSIHRGDDQSTVQYNCGSPMIVNQGTQSFYEGLVDTTTWVYRFDAYQPPLILEFQNNKLTKINSQ